MKQLYICTVFYEDLKGYFVDGQMYEFHGFDGDDKLKLKNENGEIVSVPSNCFERASEE